MMTDPITEERLSLVRPELAVRVRAAARELAETHQTYFRVSDGLRTYEEQDRLYAQGRSIVTADGRTERVPGAIVTYAKGGFSNHNFGMAVDCYPFLTGCEGPLNFRWDTPQFNAMVLALKGQGLVWGGDWHHVDRPHFQLPTVPVTPDDEDRALYAKGGLPLVWARYQIGPVSPSLQELA